MSTIKTRLISFFSKNHERNALIVFHAVVILICIINFVPGKFYIGWDALNPEFDVVLNLKRAVFASWQENYGLGLLGGHGFAATIPHTLLIAVFKLFSPTAAVRILFTYIGFYVGGLGVYVLVRKLLFLSHPMHQHGAKTPLLSLLAALFYILNLGTMQMFYTQLEAFVFHFAFLPWLFWIVIRILQNGWRKNVVLFVIINFFASSQGFIPPLFIAYMMSLALFLTACFFHKISFLSLKRIISIVILTICINAYWLFPLGYYSLYKSDIYLNSYTNLQSTAEFIDRNKNYGNLFDVALMKGFLFDSYQFDQYVYQPWVDHLANPLVQGAGYYFFALVALGFFSIALREKSWFVKGFTLVGLFYFTGITTGVFPFSVVTNILQEYMPVYRQAFRIAFTKFSLGVAFSYSLFFAFGVNELIRMVGRLSQKRRLPDVIISVLFIGLLFYGFPYFTGNFFYKKLILDVPNAYLQVMDYFQDKEHARIADFPQDCPEGWFSYNWGYFGSGFYWYGVRQPFLSRPFDVWSNYNENYYWELTQALREEKFEYIPSLLAKYDVKWILYDPNLIHCRNQKSFLNHDKFVSFLDASADFTLVETFTGDKILPIRLYEYNKKKVQNYITFQEQLPNIQPVYGWEDDDVAYRQEGDYSSRTDAPVDIYYPFRGLFSKKINAGGQFKVENKKSQFIFHSLLPPQLTGFRLSLGKLGSILDAIPVVIELRRNIDSSYEVWLSYQLPEIYIDGNKLLGNTQTKIGELNGKDLSAVKVYINGIENAANTQSYNSALYLTLSNKIVITDLQNNILFQWEADKDVFFQELLLQEVTLTVPKYVKGELTVSLPKVQTETAFQTKFVNLFSISPQRCFDDSKALQNIYEYGTVNQKEFIRMKAKNYKQCIYLHFDQLPTAASYFVELRSRHLTGNLLKYYIKNKNRYIMVEQNIPDNSELTSNYYVIPSSFPNEFGLDITVENDSFSYDETVNDFAGVGVWSIPLKFLKEMKIENTDRYVKGEEPIFNYKTIHNYETKYIVEYEENISSPKIFLTLSQSFDDGWKAYRISCQLSVVSCKLKAVLPFLFFPEIKDHILVNNWENGWIIQRTTYNLQPTTILIVYLPQYLQYLGFGLLALVVLLGGWQVMIRMQSHHPHQTHIT